VAPQLRHPPPALEADDDRASFNDPRYAGLSKERFR
jgi:2,3-bisphosphoglycerate-dependent phosphoglycerate mutase